jgi:hypothetical protein
MAASCHILPAGAGGMASGGRLAGSAKLSRAMPD